MCCSGSVPNCPADFAPLPPSASGKARAPRWGHGEAAGSGDPKVRFMYPPPPGHDSFRTPRPGRRGGEMTCVYPRHRRRGSPHWRERTWWPALMAFPAAVRSVFLPVENQMCGPSPLPGGPSQPFPACPDQALSGPQSMPEFETTQVAWRRQAPRVCRCSCGDGWRRRGALCSSCPAVSAGRGWSGVRGFVKQD
ncbi:uncharacterized protein LOC143673867 isoform X2 [Tamandua tetradactyla]|uniref:uncharacterized protein LOC143673867 isoform X2 n=1 Tax=Tamandua tetradactyla TaxID=48850 RepID=UPI0040547896